MFSWDFPARSAVVLLLATVVLSACGKDNKGPTGPSENFDIVGPWQWSVINASGGGVTCSVNSVTLTFTREEGDLVGKRFASGGGNMPCVLFGESKSVSFTTNTAIQSLSHSGTSIGFQFATTTGTWTMSGSVTGDNRMEGTATIPVLLTTGSTVMITGPWVATR